VFTKKVKVQELFLQGLFLFVVLQEVGRRVPHRRHRWNRKPESRSEESNGQRRFVSLFSTKIWIKLIQPLFGIDYCRPFWEYSKTVEVVVYFFRDFPVILFGFYVKPGFLAFSLLFLEFKRLFYVLTLFNDC
jgi:hypothetical protein